MMFLGHFTLGQFVHLPLSCADGDREPGAPTTAPTVKVYDSAGVRQLSALMPPLDRYNADGLFSYRLRLGDGFAVGTYVVSFSYLLSGATYIRAARFQVVAGGDGDGAVVAIHAYDRPHGRFLVQRLDSDQRVLARGPGP